MEEITTVETANPFDQQADLLKKWLRYLYYVEAIMLVVSVLHSVPRISSLVTVWLNRILSILAVVILFHLIPGNSRYRKAAIFGAVGTCGSILIGIRGSMLETTAGMLLSVCSLIGTYQEYHAHSELIWEKDEKLSAKWASLFTWEFLIGMAVSLLSTSAVLAVASMEIASELLVSAVLIVLIVPEVIIKLLYLKYLKIMLSMLE